MQTDRILLRPLGRNLMPRHFINMQLEVLKYKKVPHLEGLSSNYSKSFRAVYKGLLSHAESTFRRRM